MMVDLRKRVQNLALHPLPGILGARHDKLGEPFLQESFALGTRSRLEKLVLTQEICDLNDCLSIAVYLVLEYSQQMR